MNTRTLQRLRRRDSAVSPVIAVILMVAITVVLAATVYVWVSGFSAGGQGAARTVSLSSNGPETSDFEKRFTIASATPGLKYSEISITIDGATYDFDGTTAAADGEWSITRGGIVQPGTAVVSAGDQIEVDGAVTLVGSTLRVIDLNANSVMSTLAIG